MIKTILQLALLLLTISTVTPAQIQVPLKPAKWTVDVEAKNLPVYRGPDGGIAVDLPVSPTPDPNAQPPHYGYITRNWGQSIIRGQFIATFMARVSGSPVFNDEDQGCVAPATARIYFWNQDVYNTVDGTRWWSNPVSVKLTDLLSGQPITITVNLDPSQWADQYGHVGTLEPDAFYHTAAAPAGIGFTMGGCFFGHGVNTTGGNVTLELLELSYGN
jgi:hypothetical protein